jgi:hypothetical protein
MTAIPGDRLEELVESRQAIERATAGRQHDWFRLERKRGKRDHFGVIASEAFPNSGYAAIHDSGFGSQPWRPGADEVESNILVAPRSGHVQFAGIRLQDGGKYVLVFQGIAGKCLHFGVDDPIYAAGRQYRILRGTGPGILWSYTGRKRERRKGDVSSSRRRVAC